MDVLDSEGVVGTVGMEGDSCLVVVKGTADFQARPEFAVWIRSLHDEVLHLGLERVIVDIRELEFMSSMCVNVFVGWLVTILELPPSQHYEVHFRWEKGRFWQRKSIGALRRLAMMIVSADPELR